MSCSAVVHILKLLYLPVTYPSLGHMSGADPQHKPLTYFWTLCSRNYQQDNLGAGICDVDTQTQQRNIGPAYHPIVELGQMQGNILSSPQSIMCRQH